MEPAASRALPGPTFTGWRVVFALAAVQACGIGLLFVFGIVVGPIADEFGMSMAAMGSGMSIFVLSLGLLGAFLGPVIDRGPIRTVMLCGVGVMLVGFAVMVQARAPWQLAAGLVIASLGVAAYGPLPINSVIVNWFVQKRGTALAISAAGPAAAGFVIPPAIALLVAWAGWRTALGALALTGALVAFPLIASMLVRRPEDVGQHPDGIPPSRVPGADPPEAPPQPIAALVRSRDFWLMAVGFGVVFCVPVGTLIYLVPYMGENGISPEYAAYALSVQAVCALVGSLSAGALADRWPPKALLFGLLALFPLSFGAMLMWPTYPVIVAAAGGLGLAMGGVGPFHPLLIGMRFGREVVGRVMGYQGPIGLPFLLTAAPLAGLLRDQTGSFDAVFAAASGVTLVAAALLLGLRIRPAT